jgi:hypothetical protein
MLILPVGSVTVISAKLSQFFADNGGVILLFIGVILGLSFVMTWWDVTYGDLSGKNLHNWRR